MYTSHGRFGFSLLFSASTLLLGCGGDERGGGGPGSPSTATGADMQAAGATTAGGATGVDAGSGTGGSTGDVDADVTTATTGAGGDGGGQTGDGGAATGAEDAGNGEPKEYTRQPCQLVSAAEGDGAPAGPELEVEVVVEGVEIPWGLAWLPNGDLLFTERDKGLLRVVKDGQLQSGAVAEVDVAEISLLEELGDLGSEGGLLGVLLHPDFDDNHTFYMYWTARKSDDSLINRLGLFSLSEDFNSAELDRILIDDIPGGLHHQGGRMRIGPDGKLYVGVGAYEANLAQQPGEVAGKMLRMNLDGSIPDDNPTAGSYVFLTGIRNTQGFDWFDAHHLLVMEHGPTFIDNGGPFARGWDELNVFKAGENSGWPDVLRCDTAPGITEPVIVWERSLPPGGATLYRGDAIPEWKGSFFAGTLGLPVFPEEGQHLHRIQLSPDNPYVVEKREVYLKQQYGRLRTVAEGPDGYLYVTTSNCDSRGRTATSPDYCSGSGDKILRIVGVD